MSLTTQFKTDPSRELEGVVLQNGKNSDGSIPGFRVTRLGNSNTKYTKLLEKMTRPYRRQIEMQTLETEKSEDIFLDVFCRTVLIGWENVLLSDVTGNKKDKGFAEFSPEHAKQLMKRLPDLYQDITEQAKMAYLFRSEDVEAEAKN